MEKILLGASDYYTQRNNTYKPFEACMPTSWLMWAIADGRKTEIKDFCDKNGIDINQFDDWCMRFLNTVEACMFADQKYPSLRPDYPPNQIHGMFHSYLEPHIFGAPVSDFFPEKISFLAATNQIVAGVPLWSSGAFEGVHGPIDGHAIAFVGTTGDALLLADPYGDFRTKYTNAKGYAVPMSEDDFNRHVKPVMGLIKNIHIRRGINL